MITFDPDKFVLTKTDFLNILDRIGNRWKKNRKDNWKLIIEIEATKVFVRMKSEESISQLWGEILIEFNEILIENSIAIDKNDGEHLLETFEKIKHGTKLKSS